MRIVIVGIGKVGRALAEHLSREGHDVAVIDNRPGMAERLAEELDVLGIEGNGAAYTVQQQARASQADLVIAATSEDEVNMIACMTAKKLGAKNTIARVRSVEYESQLRFMQQEMGLSLSINPERETARDIARILRFPAVAKVETFAKGRVELVEYHIPQGSLLDGMALKNVAASLQVKVLVCAVRRGEEVVIPDGNYVLGAGDCISVTAKPQELENFFRALGVFRDHARNVMVVGAGRITRFLAEQLSQMKMRVRVVDRDEQRCVDLSEAVPTALVIHGDATDVHLLAEEGLDDSDAFVALTGLDELSLGLRQGNYRLRQGDANGQQQPHRDEQPGPVPPLGSKAAAKQRACRQQHRYHQCHRQGQLQQGGHQSFHPCQLLSSSRARRCPAINSSSSARSRSVRSRLSTRDATMWRREDWYIFPKKLRLAQRR